MIVLLWISLRIKNSRGPGFFWGRGVTLLSMLSLVVLPVFHSKGRRKDPLLVEEICEICHRILYFLTRPEFKRNFTKN
jgi:hypothetical protein